MQAVPDGSATRPSSMKRPPSPSGSSLAAPKHAKRAIECAATDLAALKPRALREMAIELGIGHEAIETAFDEDDVKGALVAMIVARAGEPAPSGDAALREELAGTQPNESSGIDQPATHDTVPSALDGLAYVTGC